MNWDCRLCDTTTHRTGKKLKKNIIKSESCKQWEGHFLMSIHSASKFKSKARVVFRKKANWKEPCHWKPVLRKASIMLEGHKRPQWSGQRPRVYPTKQRSLTIHQGYITWNDHFRDAYKLNLLHDEYCMGHCFPSGHQMLILSSMGIILQFEKHIHQGAQLWHRLNRIQLDRQMQTFGHPLLIAPMMDGRG